MYKLAADQGHHNAQLNLGNMYAKGKGVIQSDEIAFKYTKLSKQLSSLTSLNVARNWFTDIPIGIQQLTCLKALDMTHNMLQASNLVTSIHHFKNLKNLHYRKYQR